jgi:nucleoside-diphosphate-sugar epimerase
MIAVTGATGLLGGVILEHLQTSGIHAIGISRQDTGKPLSRTAPLDDPLALERAFEGVETIVHAAGLVSFNPRRRRELYATNVQGTANVVNAALRAGVRKIIHISSVASLPRPLQGDVITEAATWKDSKTNFPSYYGQTKYLAEIEIFRGGEEGLQVMTLNPSVILAPSASLRSSARVFEYVLKEKWFYTNAWLNYVDARDVAAAVSAALQNFPTGERIILNGGSMPYIDFFKALGHRLKKRPPFVQVNHELIWVAAAAEELRAFLFRAEPIITRPMANSLRKKVLYNSQKSIKLINMEYRKFEDTVDWCCGFYRDHVNSNY